LVESDNKKAVGELEGVDESEIHCVECDLCGDVPCMWLAEREHVVANDEMLQGHKVTVENSTRRKFAYRYMFRAINGGPGEKGVRKKQPECVENGIRALFPDLHYMGFKEE
jgi:hypothetical protein